jgi:hypothetical protein
MAPGVIAWIANKLNIALRVGSAIAFLRVNMAYLIAQFPSPAISTRETLSKNASDNEPNS